MENKLKKYKQITEICYPDYPRNFFEKIMKIKSKYESKMVYVSKNKEIVGGGLVIKLGQDIYGVSGIVINPKYQRKGFGKMLMNKIHREHRGLFILITRNKNKGFYERLGYKLIKKKGNTFWLSYLNDINIIKF